MSCKAPREVTFFNSSAVGVPRVLTISSSCLLVLLPLNSGRRASSSPKMHPALHTSTPAPYVSASHSSSGARYHLVTTYSVSCPSVCGGEGGCDRARQRHGTLQLQVSPLPTRHEPARSHKCTGRSWRSPGGWTASSRGAGRWLNGCTSALAGAGRGSTGSAGLSAAEPR